MALAPHIRKAVDADIPAIPTLAMSSFGTTEGPEIVQLIGDLLVDVTAQPLLSLVATVDGRVVGHVLFSKVRLKPAGQEVSAALLAPLAVHPDCQSQGIGGQLVAAGLEQLSGAGVDLVFVLGHPRYYPRFGFLEAGVKGFDAPYPIAEKNAAAWMVRERHPGVIGRTRRQVICADALTAPEYWRE